MGGNIKKIISLIVGIPAFMIFAGETSNEFFWMQIVAALVLVGLYMWNVWGTEYQPFEIGGRHNNNSYKHTTGRPLGRRTW